MDNSGGGDGKPCKKGDDEKKPESKPAKSLLVVFVLLILLPAVNAIEYEVTTFKQEFSYLTDATTIWYGGDGTYDDLGKDVNIGFTFRYFGHDYTRVNVSTNGYITLLDTSVSPGSAYGSDDSNDPIPDTNDPDNFLAPWWDDLVVRSQGTKDKVSHKTSGSSPNRVFTVEYKSISSYHDKGGSFLQFQVKLYETTNVVEFLYFNDSSYLDFTASATIGIENADGSYGVGGPSTGNTISVMPKLNYRFTPKEVTPLTSDASQYVDLSEEKKFSFNVQNYDWAVAGIRNIDGYDHDIMVDDDSTFSSPTDSNDAGNVPDFVVVNGHRNYGAYYAKDYYGIGSGKYNRIEAEAETTDDLTMDVAMSGSMSSDEVNEMYEVWLNQNVEYKITLDITSGSADLDLYLFSEGTTIADKSTATKYSTSGGGGQDESIRYKPSTSGDVGIVVVHDGTGSDSADYTIKVEQFIDYSPTITADASPGAESYNDGMYDWFNATTLTNMNVDVSASKGADATELRGVYWRLTDNSGNPVQNTQDLHKNTTSYFSYDIFTTSDNAGWLDGQSKLSKTYDDFEIETHLNSSQLAALSDNALYNLEWRVDENPLPSEGGGSNYQGITTYRFKIDRASPTTSISFSGAQGQLGWYNSSAQVTLSASDSASGVASTKYCTSSSSCAPDMTYSSAFNVSSEGTTYVRYRSTDRVGNTESTRNATLKIDKTGPSSLITSPSAGSAQATDFSVSATDSDSTSGLDKCEYKVVSNGAETKPWTARTCSSSFSVTVGSGNDCRHDGTNTCAVFIRANDKAGNLGSAVSRSFSISTNKPPNASFTVTPTSGDTTTTFYVDASSSTDDKDPVTSLQVRWDWENDGIWDTGWMTTKINSRKYTAAGTYTIKLEVKDTGGLTSTATRQVTVTLPNNPPVAKIKALTWVTQSKAFTLDGSGSYDPDGDTLTYSWSDNYGDFIGVTGAKPTVTLNTIDNGNKKKHTITLTVSDGRGGVSTDTVEVTVIPPWAPRWENLIEEYRYDDTNTVGFSQEFYWEQDHLDYFKNGDVDYQWELRRPDSDEWDFVVYNPLTGGCKAQDYWSDLPGWPDKVKWEFAEENHWILDNDGNPVLPCIEQGNPFKNQEEAEIKHVAPNDLQPNTKYKVFVELKRKKLWNPIEIITKSEFCGNDWINCEFTPKWLDPPFNTKLNPVYPLLQPPWWKEVEYQFWILKVTGKVKYDYYFTEKKEIIS